MLKAISRVGIMVVVLVIIGVFGFVFGLHKINNEITDGTVSMKNINIFNTDTGTNFEIDKNPITSVEIVTDIIQVEPGSLIPLNVNILPYNARSTIESVEYYIGYGTFANISNGYLYVNTDAKIGAKIEVYAVADNVVSFNRLVFTVVEIPVESVVINNNETVITEGRTLQLDTSVEPVGATNKAISYSIISENGIDYASISPNGLIKVIGSLPAGNLSITVRAASISDIEKYDDVTFNLYVPVAGVSILNSITEVEQSRCYQFDAKIWNESRATESNTPVSYTISRPDIATISPDGELYIQPNAPVGMDITVTITAADGVTATRKVTVIPVCATDITASESLAIDPRGYLPDDEITFTVDYLTAESPYNVSDEDGYRLKDYFIEVVYGDTVIATIISNKIVKIKNIKEIEKCRPSFTVRIYYAFDITIYKDITIEVYIPIQEITLTKIGVSRIDEDERYEITNILSKYINNEFANVQEVTYHITGEYAYKEENEGYVHIKDNLTKGNLSFGIYAEADGVISNTLIFSIYVSTAKLEIDIDKPNPYSWVDEGQFVTITTTIDSEATNQMPVFEIADGGNLIVSGYIVSGKYLSATANSDGTATATFKVKQNLITVPNEEIKIEISHSDISSKKLALITIYKPTESGFIADMDINRGFPQALVVSRLYPSDTQYKISSVSLEGVDIVDNGTIIKVPPNTPAGTVITVGYYARNEALNRNSEVFYAKFKVNSLANAGTNTSYGTSVRESKKYNVVYGKDADNIQIKEARQLKVGKTATITVDYGGVEGKMYDAQGKEITSVDLATFGLNIYSVSFTVKNKSGVVQTTTGYKVDVIDYRTIRATVPSNADGNHRIYFTIKMQDGMLNDKPNTFDLAEQWLDVFNPIKADSNNNIMDIDLSIGDILTPNNSNDLYIGSTVDIINWDSKYTFAKSNLVWNDNSGVVSSSGEIVSGYDFTGIKVSAEQSYNGNKIFIDKSFPLTSLTYKNDAGTVISRMWKRIIDTNPNMAGMQAPSIQLLGASSGLTKTGILREYQVTDNSLKDITFDYVLYGWNTSQGEKMIETLYEGTEDLILTPSWVSTMATTGQIYENGYIYVSEGDGNKHSSNKTIDMNIEKLIALGYSKIQLNIQYEINDYKNDWGNSAGTGSIWIDINGSNVWSTSVSTTNTDGYDRLGKTDSVGISAFGDGETFTARFGMSATNDSDGKDDEWRFNEGGIRFTAIKE